MEAFKHGYDGNCKPGKHYSEQQTFSVGIFQWLPKASGKGVKRSAVKYRVRGNIDNADAVFARALEVCTQLDAGQVFTKKSESIG